MTLNTTGINTYMAICYPLMPYDPVKPDNLTPEQVQILTDHLMEAVRLNEINEPPSGQIAEIMEYLFN